jgi:hypothetical protein
MLVNSSAGREDGSHPARSGDNRGMCEGRGKERMTDTNLAGSCFCGSVRYRLTRAPMFVHCCHCRDCQKQTGGAFAINALIERSCIERAEGSRDPVRVTVKTDSGRPHDIYRCPQCQSALWSDYGRRGVMVFLRVATLDEGHGIEPTSTSSPAPSCPGSCFRRVPAASTSITT